MKRAYHNLYYRGMEAREQGKPREAVPAFLDGIEKGWWLAGWGDMDIELETEKAKTKKVQNLQRKVPA